MIAVTIVSLSSATWRLSRRAYRRPALTFCRRPRKPSDTQRRTDTRRHRWAIFSLSLASPRLSAFVRSSKSGPAWYPAWHRMWRFWITRQPLVWRLETRVPRLLSATASRSPPRSMANFPSFAVATGWSTRPPFSMSLTACNHPWRGGSHISCLTFLKAHRIS